MDLALARTLIDRKIIRIIKGNWELNQDGRVEGCKTHLPPWTHQKHTYMWESSHCKLPGNRQKASCTTKALRKTYTEPGRKRREAVRLEPAHLGGRLGRKGRLHWWRSILGSELSKSHAGVWHRNSGALGRWDSWWDSQEGCGKPGLWLRGAQAVFWQWVEKLLKWLPVFPAAIPWHVL